MAIISKLFRSEARSIPRVEGQAPRPVESRLAKASPTTAQRQYLQGNLDAVTATIPQLSQTMVDSLPLTPLKAKGGTSIGFLFHLGDKMKVEGKPLNQQGILEYAGDYFANGMARLIKAPALDVRHTVVTLKDGRKIAHDLRAKPNFPTDTAEPVPSHDVNQWSPEGLVAVIQDIVTAQVDHNFDLKQTNYKVIQDAQGRVFFYNADKDQANITKPVNPNAGVGHGFVVTFPSLQDILETAVVRGDLRDDGHNHATLEDKLPAGLTMASIMLDRIERYEAVARDPKLIRELMAGYEQEVLKGLPKQEVDERMTAAVQNIVDRIGALRPFAERYLSQLDELKRDHASGDVSVGQRLHELQVRRRAEKGENAAWVEKYFNTPYEWVNAHVRERNNIPYTLEGGKTGRMGSVDYVKALESEAKAAKDAQKVEKSAQTNKPSKDKSTKKA